MSEVFVCLYFNISIWWSIFRLLWKITFSTSFEFYSKSKSWKEDADRLKGCSFFHTWKSITFFSNAVEKSEVANLIWRQIQNWIMDLVTWCIFVNVILNQWPFFLPLEYHFFQCINHSKHRLPFILKWWNYPANKTTSGYTSSCYFVNIE